MVRKVKKHSFQNSISDIPIALPLASTMGNGERLPLKACWQASDVLLA